MRGRSHILPGQLRGIAQFSLLSHPFHVRWTLASIQTSHPGTYGHWRRRHPPGPAKTAGLAAGWAVPGFEDMVIRSSQCTVSLEPIRQIPHIGTQPMRFAQWNYDFRGLRARNCVAGRAFCQARCGALRCFSLRSHPFHVSWTLASPPRRHPPGAAKTAGLAAGWAVPGFKDMVIRSPQCSVFEHRLDKSRPLGPNRHDLLNGIIASVGCGHGIAWPVAHSARPAEFTLDGRWRTLQVHVKTPRSR